MSKEIAEHHRACPSKQALARLGPKMGCASSTPTEAQSLVSNSPLPKGHKLLAELAFLSEVQQGWRDARAQCPPHLQWIAVLGDDAIAKWVKDTCATSTKRKEIEEAGSTVEAFEGWGNAIGPKIEAKEISPYALQISWEVGQHATVAHGDLARY